MSNLFCANSNIFFLQGALFFLPWCPDQVTLTFSFFVGIWNWAVYKVPFYLSRLKHMLSDVMQQQQQQQQQEPMQQNSQQRKPQESSAAPPGSPNVFDQFGFLPPPMNIFSIPPFGSFPNMVPGMQF